MTSCLKSEFRFRVEATLEPVSLHVDFGALIQGNGGIISTIELYKLC